jgi:ubiquinone/menaquinone biosynthesis C-methylase UbiE
MSRIADGAIPSPNIWRSPRVYEIENRAVDPDGVIETAMSQVRSWQGVDVLDIGCGTGYHLPRFAATAAQVWGVEPHADLAGLARRRCRALSNVTVRSGSAQRLPLPDASVDVAHARWAYFFGPGCEPGLAELDRVVRRGGVGFIIDNDPTRSTFGRWFTRAMPAYDPRAVDEFFSRHGWSAVRRLIRWEFENRADFESVVGIEFSADQAARILAEHAGCRVDYAITIRVRHF